MLTNEAPSPAKGFFADGYSPLAERFAANLRSGEETGAAITIYVRGRCVADLWGGLADTRAQRPWERDTRIVLFSVTKGLSAMALHLLADRGLLDWDAPVAQYWPGFAASGKANISVRTLLNHRGGLAGLNTRLWLADFTNPEKRAEILTALETQPPLWEPGENQGYHAMTFGMYAAELFERVAGEAIGPFLRREIFEPLGSDLHLGTPASLDPLFATLYTPKATSRVGNMVRAAFLDRETPEARIAKAITRKGSLVRKAFGNPATGPRGIHAYNDEPVRRASLAWGSATGSAHGLARAYLPFAMGGEFDGRRYLREETIAPVYRRQGWSERDLVLEKPLGWSQGFLKEERHMFSPNPESFGHSGMGGTLGWCDPADQLTLGYVTNQMDWRVRSPRCVALCHALYSCEPLLESRLR